MGVGGGLDLGGQLLSNGFQIECVDYRSVGKSALVGGLGGAFGVGTSSVLANAAFGGGTLNVAANGNPIGSVEFATDFITGGLFGAAGALGTAPARKASSAVGRGLQQGLFDLGGNTIANLGNLSNGSGTSGDCGCR